MQNRLKWIVIYHLVNHLYDNFYMVSDSFNNIWVIECLLLHRMSFIAHHLTVNKNRCQMQYILVTGYIWLFCTITTDCQTQVLTLLFLCVFLSFSSTYTILTNAACVYGA